jgi:SAM-dependent MidA family methyltransferase
VRRKKKVQKKNLFGQKVKWIKSFDNIKSGPIIFLGNEFFDAIPIKQFKKINNTIYEKYVKFALENNYTDQAFINNVKHAKGRLGCNLSHQLLLKEILINSSTEWNLILEDDVVLKDYDVEKINHIIKKVLNC